MTFSDTPLTRAALAYATAGHANQTRWDPKVPFITHPIRVAQKAIALYDETYTKLAFLDARTMAVVKRERELVYVVSLSHDLAEDSPGYTEKGIAQHFFDLGLINQTEWGQIVDALTRLNKHRSTDYLAFTLAAKGFWLSRLVKCADIADNLADQAKGSVAAKYQLALHILST